VIIAASAAMSRADAPDDGPATGPSAASATWTDAGTDAQTAAATSPGSAAHGTAASAPRPDPVRQLRNALGAAALEGLTLEPAGERVIVRGVLASRAEVDRLNQLLDHLPPTWAVSRRFVAVPEIIDRLYESMPDSGLKVAHVGKHHFQISGSVDDLDRATQAVDRIAADLAEFGLRIDTTLQERHAGIPALSGMLVDSQGTSFLRTRDGVKHIVPAASARQSKAEATR
jgi:hypothetical protein